MAPSVSVKIGCTSPTINWLALEDIYADISATLVACSDGFKKCLSVEATDEMAAELLAIQKDVDAIFYRIKSFSKTYKTTIESANKWPDESQEVLRKEDGTPRLYEKMAGIFDDSKDYYYKDGVKTAPRQYDWIPLLDLPK